MTHVHAPVIRPNAEIADRAREVHPLQFTARMLLTTIAFFFTSIGWLAGTAWFIVVFSVLWAASRTGWLVKCAQYGFAKGAHGKIVADK